MSMNISILTNYPRHEVHVMALEGGSILKLLYLLLYQHLSHCNVNIHHYNLLMYRCIIGKELLN